MRKQDKKFGPFPDDYIEVADTRFYGRCKGKGYKAYVTMRPDDCDPPSEHDVSTPARTPGYRLYWIFVPIIAAVALFLDKILTTIQEHLATMDTVTLGEIITWFNNP